MNKVLYVVELNGRWQIESGAMNLGPYSTKTDAVLAAVEAASLATKNGLGSQVIAKAEDPREWETVWPPKVKRSGQ